MFNYYVGLDLGQAQDYTALTVIEKTQALPRPGYHVRHLERPELGTSYPAIVDRVQALMRSPELRGQAALVVDATGVGRPVVDLFRKAKLRPVAITITGGNEVTSVSGGFNVPKRDLITTLQVLFQSGDLKVASRLPLAQVLVQELLNFKVKINVKTAHDSYEAWREGVHDDLVLAVALAAWYGKRQKGARFFYAKPRGW